LESEGRGTSGETVQFLPTTGQFQKQQKPRIVEQDSLEQF
jgi:hypothetical protein